MFPACLPSICVSWVGGWHWPPGWTHTPACLVWGQLEVIRGPRPGCLAVGRSHGTRCAMVLCTSSPLRPPRAACPASCWQGHSARRGAPEAGPGLSCLTSELLPKLPKGRHCPRPGQGPTRELEVAELGWTASRPPSHRAAPTLCSLGLLSPAVPITANPWGLPDPEARLSAAEGPAPALTAPPPGIPGGGAWNRAKVAWLHRPPAKGTLLSRCLPPQSPDGPRNGQASASTAHKQPAVGGRSTPPLGSAPLAKLPPHPVHGPGPWFVASWRRTQVPSPAA